MGTREEIHSDLAIPPGEFLAEVLEDLNMSQADLARRMGRPAQAINEIIRGTKALTPETALQLEQVVGVPAHIWLGLEAEYRLVSARQADAEQVRRETQLLAAFPYREMVKLGCFAAVRKAEDKVRELRRFFGVASLQQLGAVPAYAPAFRLGGGSREPSPFGLAAWLHCGFKEGSRMDVAPFDATKLRALVPTFRGLTSAPTSDVASELRAQLAACGVALVVFPHFPKTYAHGATFWIEPRKKAVVLSSVRGRWADIFWFSFFHELGHLLLHGHSTFVEMDYGADVRTPEEEGADRFARDTLIPAAEYAAFVQARDFQALAVTRFATQMDIHPGIVVGRLQHEGLVSPDRLNGLRIRYALASAEVESVA
jgi:HTH-type transcriptional regulator/antitoxin HigA